MKRWGKYSFAHVSVKVAGEYHFGKVDKISLKRLSVSFLIMPISWFIVLTANHTVFVQVKTSHLMSHVIRKPVFAICEQQRRRSACAMRSLISTFVIRCLDSIIHVPLVSTCISKISSL